MRKVFNLVILFTTALFTAHAQSDVDSLLSAWHNSELADTSRLAAIDYMASKVYLQLDADSAYVFAEQEYQFAKTLYDQTGPEQDEAAKYMAQALKTQASSLRLRGQYDEALKHYEASSDLQAELGDTLAIASCLNGIGIVYAQQNQFGDALKYFKLALVEFRAAGDKGRIAAALNNIGIFHLRTGAYAKAVEYYTESLEIREETGDKSGVATSQNNIGNVYRALGDYKNAIAYHEKSLATRRELGDEYTIVQSLNNLGNIILEKDFEEHSILRETEAVIVDYDRAGEYFKEALERAIKSDNQKEMSRAYEGKANIYQHFENYPAAIEFYQKSLALKEKMSNRAGISTTLNNLGVVHLELGEIALNKGDTKTGHQHIREAIKLQTQALELAGDIGVLVEGRDACKALYKSYKLMGNTSAALRMHELYIQKRDSMMSLENQHALLDQEYQYEYGKKVMADSLNMVMERQALAQTEADMILEQKAYTYKMIGGAAALFIIFLSGGFIYRINQKRKLTAKEFEANALKLKGAESEMKALRSQMNPHFIFNALQSIQTYLLNKNTTEANEYLLRFSKLMRSVLENSRHEEVPIEEDFRSLGLYMELESIRLKHPFTYSFDIAPDVDVEDIYIPPLILQPFVENAIWHGLQYKQEPGHIEVSVHKDGANLICSVVDNGIGRQASAGVIQQSHVKKESLGMKITEERLRVRNERTGTMSSYAIHDLVSDGEEAIGTKVNLIISIAA